MSDTVATLLLLADARLPAGGHAHSGGAGGRRGGRPGSRPRRPRQFPAAGAWPRPGSVAAAFAAAACARPDEPPILDVGLDARTPRPRCAAPRGPRVGPLLRVGRAMWPQLVLTAHLRHEDRTSRWRSGSSARPPALTPCQVGTAAAYGAVAGPASAAIRLLGLDPYAGARRPRHVGARVSTPWAQRRPTVPHDPVESCRRRAPRSSICTPRATPTGRCVSLRPDTRSTSATAHRPSPWPGHPRRTRIAHRHRRAGGLRQDRVGGGAVPALRDELSAGGRDQRHLHHRGRRLSCGATRCSRTSGSSRSRRVLPAHRDPRRHLRQPGRDRTSSSSRLPTLDLILVESGGDNLTATFSQGLVDRQIFVIDVAGGDKVPRKGGPG